MGMGTPVPAMVRSSDSSTISLQTISIRGLTLRRLLPAQATETGMATLVAVMVSSIRCLSVTVCMTLTEMLVSL